MASSQLTLENDPVYAQHFEELVNRRFRPEHRKLTLKWRDHMAAANIAKAAGDEETYRNEKEWARLTDEADRQVLSDWIRAGIMCGASYVQGPTKKARAL